MKPICCPKFQIMNITNLPSEIMTIIFCRLPMGTIISCMRVCKSWFDLIQSQHFADDHLRLAKPPLSGSGMVVFHAPPSSTCNFVEIFQGNDDLFIGNVSPDLKIPPITHEQVCSTNGLLLYRTDHCLVLCNPITGESLELVFPSFRGAAILCYGLGVSPTTGLHKAVLLSWRRTLPHFAECYVYTLETRSRRKMKAAHQWEPYFYGKGQGGVFVNGKLHWLVNGPKDRNPLLSCFDLETELFTVFHLPRLSPRRSMSLFAWEDRLGLCANTPFHSIVLWLMTKDMKSWTWSKKLDIEASIYNFQRVEVIKIFKDGDILMVSCGTYWYYSRKMGTMKAIDPFITNYAVARAYTPTFLLPPLH